MKTNMDLSRTEPFKIAWHGHLNLFINVKNLEGKLSFSRLILKKPLIL
jgi:hypothetical protein